MYHYSNNSWVLLFSQENFFRLRRHFSPFWLRILTFFTHHTTYDDDYANHAYSHDMDTLLVFSEATAWETQN